MSTCSHESDYCAICRPSLSPERLEEIRRLDPVLAWPEEIARALRDLLADNDQLRSSLDASTRRVLELEEEKAKRRAHPGEEHGT